MMPSSGFVLLVEDDSDVRESLEELLESHGLTVTAASNGAEALAALASGARPNVILLDLMMPESDGFEFRKRQLELAAVCDIPVVVCTADAAAARRAPEMGDVEWVRKPFDIDELIQVVRKHCNSA
jgi:CheY-like chemotaxis protein